MGYALFLVLVFQTASATMIADTGKWDVEELSKRLHNPHIDLDCGACKAIVETIQYLVRQNTSEDEIAAFATLLCEQLQIETDNLVCIQGVQEFKVSRAVAAMIQFCSSYLFL